MKSNIMTETKSLIIWQKL